MNKTKKITNIYELREIKSRLLVERMELEKKMNSDWELLKESLTAKNMIKQILASTFKQESEKSNGLSEMMGGLLMKAGNKLISQMSRKIHQWTN
ncbi:MAG: hypothetical protein RIR96_1387 [Bacteroidota bacterium]|jgi:hypothetical protein